MNIKENDFFHFRTTKVDSHCFEGLLMAVKNENGELFLADTFWGIGDTSGRTFTIAQAEEKGELKLYCNLDNIEKISRNESDYYDDKDIVMLSRQHACSENCRHYYKRKGSQRSKDKMLRTITEKIDTAVKEAKWLLNDVARLTEIKAKIEAGDTSVYL